MNKATKKAPKSFTDQSLKKLNQNGYYADPMTRNLYFRVQKDGASKTWQIRYTQNGKRKYRSLGSFDKMGIAKARKEATKQLEKISEGVELKTKSQKLKESKAPKGLTFKDTTEKWLSEVVSVDLRNKKHIKQYQFELEKYAYPIIGHLEIEKINYEHFSQVYGQDWIGDKTLEDNKDKVGKKFYLATPNTFDKFKTKCVKAMEFAYAKIDKPQLIASNPANWSAHRHKFPNIRKLIQERKVSRVTFKDYKENAILIREMMKEKTNDFWSGKNPFLLLMFTSARISEVLRSEVEDFDLKSKIPTWTKNKNNKSGKQFTHPLSKQSVQIIKDQIVIAENVGSKFLFPSEYFDTNGKTVADTTVRDYLQRFRSPKQMSIHGVRSSFNSWVDKKYIKSSDPIKHLEICKHLQEDHKPQTLISSEVYNAYHREDFLEERLILNQAWCNWLTKGRL